MNGSTGDRDDWRQIQFDQLLPATFLQRENRFRVLVEVMGKPTAAHLPNSGRLGELLVPGTPVWLAPADKKALDRRKTAFDLVLVQYAGRYVSVNAHLPGDLVAAALWRREIPIFDCYPHIEREVRLGESRIDFRLSGNSRLPPCWIEIKSVTLVKNGTALFPDAPTVRGRRHVDELIRAVENGNRAAVVFVVQRDDAHQFSPHDASDPNFSQTLQRAALAGVEVLAFCCRVELEGIALMNQIPITLPAFT